MYGLVVKFAAYTGLRAAEIEGLQVGDISTTHVTVARSSDGTVKSRTSRRKVPLTAWLADDLTIYLENHPRADDKSAPLFPSRYGRNVKGVSRATDADTYNWDKPIDLATFYANYFKPALKALGLPVTDAKTKTRGVRFHDLRHTFAVLNLTAGVHFMQVSKWLGHASFTITLNTYGDFIPTEEVTITLDRPTAPETTNVVSLPARRATQ
ncbi:MAG: tyrosine-type recombinase/integrase [Actinomycetota bacterium]|nr:tyrosine-type recombinase/integrase [Actinomycetota bacterium]